MTSTFSDVALKARTQNDKFGRVNKMPSTSKERESVQEVAERISKQIAKAIEHQFNRVKKEFDKNENK